MADAQRGQGGTSDSSAQLMEPGQAKLLGVEDDHEVASDTSTPTSMTVVATRRAHVRLKILHDLCLDGRGRASRQLMDGNASWGGRELWVGGDTPQQARACAHLLGIGDVVGGVDTRANDVDATPWAISSAARAHVRSPTRRWRCQRGRWTRGCAPACRSCACRRGLKDGHGVVHAESVSRSR